MDPNHNFTRTDMHNMAHNSFSDIVSTQIYYKPHGKIHLPSLQYVQNTAALTLCASTLKKLRAVRAEKVVTVRYKGSFKGSYSFCPTSHALTPT